MSAQTLSGRSVHGVVVRYLDERRDASGAGSGQVAGIDQGGRFTFPLVHDPPSPTSPHPVIAEDTPIVRAEMLIRRPAAEVYGSFVDPSITTRFWFTHSSGPLEPGAKVLWRWAMYEASTEVRVLDLRPSERILIEWDDPATRVEWVFTGRPDGTTFVSITNSGFVGTGGEVVRQALDSMGGFSFVLAGAKALLEHGIELNLVGDHYPDAHV